MKKLLERLKRLAAPSARLVALLAMAFATSRGLAVDPVVVWESDFGTTTKGAFTLAVPSSSWVDANGNLEVQSGNAGAVIEIDTTKGVINSKLSILIEYEGASASAPAGAVPFEVLLNSDYQCGVKKLDANTLAVSGVFQNGTTYPTSGTQTITTMPTSGVLLFSMPSGSACSVYSASSRSGLTANGAGGTIAGLTFSSANLQKIGLGGSLIAAHTNVKNFEGLKIKKLAIFASNIAASDAASYKFPSECDYTATITAANTAWSDIAWDNSATWDDNADNTAKTVSLKISNGASVIRNGGLAAGKVTVEGAGTLNFTDVAGTGATVSAPIHGTGAVVAQSGTITFSGANAFSGGLTVKSGALAKSETTSGFGIKNATVTVENGGAVDLKSTGDSTYKFNIAGTGVNNSGALYSSAAISYGSMQAQSITLTGDATINVGANWGIINSSYSAATLSLGSYTLTKKGVGRFWLANTTISGTGTISLEGGCLDTISASYTSIGADAKITVKSGATLFVGGDSDVTTDDSYFGHLSIKNLEVQTGGNVTVANGKTLTVTGSISGPDQSISIASGATLTWKNQTWSSGDYFTGQGTLELNVDSGLKEMTAPNTFSGILKLTGSRTDANYPVIGASSDDAEGIFTGMPELVLNGYMGLQDSFVGKSFSVRNFSDSNSNDRVRNNKFSAAGNKTIKTKQTKNTTVNGRFQYNGSKYTALTVYGDENASEVYSLTLSGANETLGPLTVQNKSKVVLASGGKWAGPTTVENGGYLEAQHTTSPLAAVTLNDGATVVIPSITTTTTGDNPVTTTTTTPLTATGAITFPQNGIVYVDMSNAAVAEEDGAKMIMTGASLSGITAENVNSILKETSGEYTFSIDGNSIKATNIGTCTWTGSAWDKEDPSLYDEVTVNVAEGGTTLTLNGNYSFRTVTLSGSSGTLTIAGTGAIDTDNLVIPAGVTLDASSSISASVISGGGTLHIPTGTEYEMDGVTCSAKIVNDGTLKTKGNTSLSGPNNFTVGSLLEIVSGTTEANADTGNGVGLMSGTIIIDSDGTLKALRNDLIDCYSIYRSSGSSGAELHVYGTLDVDNKRLSLPYNETPAWGNSKLYLYYGCSVVGEGDSNAAFDLVAGTIFVKPNEDDETGNVTLGVPLRLRANTTFDIATDMTLTINGVIGDNGLEKGFTKTGNGTLNFTPSSMSAFTGTFTVNAGKLLFSGSGAWTSGSTVIASGGVLESQRDAQVVGALTLEAGSTLVFGDDSQTIKTSGALTLPGDGTVTVDVSGLTIAADETKSLLSASSGATSVNKFALVGSTTHMLQRNGASGLDLVPIEGKIVKSDATQTNYASLDMALTALASIIATDEGAYVVAYGGTTEKDSSWFETNGIVYNNGIYAKAAATDGTTQYPLLSVAVAASSTDDTITLLRNVAETGVDTTGKQFTLAEGDYTFSGSFTGSGTIKMTAKPKAYTSTTTNNGSLFAEGWTGTFQVAWKPGNARFVLDDFGNANSTVEIVGVNGAFDAFPFSQWSNGGAPNVQPKVSIASGTTWTVSDGNSSLNHITTFPSLEGGGNLIVNGGTGSSERNLYYTLTRVANYTGALSGSRCNYKIVNIVTSNDDFGDCLVKVGENFGPYQLDQTTVNGVAANLCVDTLNSQKGIYKTAATVTVDATTTKYASVANATAAGQSGTVTILADTDTVAVNPSQTVVVASGVTVGTISWGAEYATVTSVTGDGTTEYTHGDAVAATYYWTGAVDSGWTTLGNWKVGASDGPNATRSLTSNDSVVFPSGTHTVALSTSNGTESCGDMTITGNVTFQRANAGTWAYLQINGDVSGTGTLTLLHVGLGALVNRTVSCPVVVDGTGGNDALCTSSGKTFTFTNTVTIDGEFKANESPLTFTGPVILNNGGYVYACGSSYRVDVRFNGGITVTENSAASLTRTAAGYHAIASQVTLNTGSTLAVPENTDVTGATFAGTGKVSFATTPGTDVQLRFGEWTGTIELPSFVAAGHNLNNYGKAGSKVLLNGITSGWLGMGTQGSSFTINPEIVLAGNFTLTDSSNRTWIFTKISGIGTVSLTPGASGHKIAVTVSELVGDDINIVNNMGNTFTINKLTLAAAPSSGALLVGTTTPDNVDISTSGANGVYVSDAKQAILIEKTSDGIYVAATTSTETVGGDTVTVLDTGDNTSVNATGISGKVAIPGSVTQITGVAAENLLLKVTYNDGTAQTKYYPILKLDGSNNVLLDETKSVDNVSVQPEPAATPALGVGTLKVATIPGLWYSLWSSVSTTQSGTTLGGTIDKPSDPIQATSTTTTVNNGAAVGSGVRYYKVVVGVTADDVKPQQ